MQEPMNRIGDLLQTWQARILAGNVQALAVVSLLVLATFAVILIPRDRASTKASSDLFPSRQLTAHEIERIEAALGQAQLLDYQVKSGRIWVPGERRGAYLAAISEATALPDAFHVPTEDAIAKSNVMETTRQRSQRLHHALEKEARLAICALPGVQDAFVKIDVATDSSLHRRTQATAVVGVKTAVDQPMDEQSFRTIQAMLLNFKTGLTPESVTITDLTSGHFFRGTVDQQSPAMVAALRQADLERQWTRRLSSALAFLPNSHLTVNVVPTQDDAQAVAVRCSISVPWSPAPGRADTLKSEQETELRQRVQAALLPLLPRRDQPIDELIAVTVYDQETLAASVASTDWPRGVSPNLLAAILVTVAGLMALLLIRNTAQTPAPEPVTHLRIYEEHEPTVDQSGDSSAQEQLQAMAIEDPRAMAASLSEFIDRAG